MTAELREDIARDRRAHLIVTGGSGYIGRRLVEVANERGIAITALGRRAIEPTSLLRSLRWELGKRVPPEAFQHDIWAAPSAIIHLAHDWCADMPEAISPRNVAAASAILDSRDAKAPHLSCVFVSSQSAQPDALNQYGRCKWAIEQIMIPGKDVSARVGLVYGGRPQGQYSTLCNLAGLTPILPMLETDRLVRPIHLDEVCTGLLALALQTPRASKPWVGLAGFPVTFGQVLGDLARWRHGARLRVIRLPTAPMLFAATVLSRMTAKGKPIRERILGLAGTPVTEQTTDLRDLGLDILPLARGLEADTWICRRRLLEEARVMLAYVSGRPAGFRQISLYVRALRQRRESALPLRLSARTIRLADARDPRLADRFDLAMRIAESARCAPAPQGRFRRLAGTALMLAGEFPFVLLRLTRTRGR